MAPQPKLTFNDFYCAIRQEFPKISRLSVWSQWDWKKEPAFHSFIMSEMAREMVAWAKEGDYAEVKKLLAYIEHAFTDASEIVVAYIGTDFTVTILETEEKEVRENIKALMQPRTAQAYRLNLNGYKEPN